MSGPLVAVTGGTGFVGKATMATLERAGFSVRALARKVPDAQGSAEWIEGDLANRDALAKLVADAEAVIHIAGLTTALAGYRVLLRAGVVAKPNVATKQQVVDGGGGELRAGDRIVTITAQPGLRVDAGVWRGARRCRRRRPAQRPSLRAVRVRRRWSRS